MSLSDLERLSSLEAKYESYHETFDDFKDDIKSDLFDIRSILQNGFSNVSNKIDIVNNRVNEIEKLHAGHDVKIKLFWKLFAAGGVAVVTTIVSLFF